MRELAELYSCKAGLNLVPGTLNVELERPWSVPAEALRLEGAEYGGRVSVSIVPCRFFGRDAFVLRTDANEQGEGDHPRTIVEIASDLPFRVSYGLRDGDRVELELP